MFTGLSLQIMDHLLSNCIANFPRGHTYRRNSRRKAVQVPAVVEGSDGNISWDPVALRLEPGHNPRTNLIVAADHALYFLHQNIADNSIQQLCSQSQASGDCSWWLSALADYKH